jgi:hypothetical protein
MEQHQSSYRFVTKYLEVFSCLFLHDYYQRGVCSDLVFKPTFQTSFLLKNYNLIFKTRTGGFALAANSDKDYSNLIFKDPFELDFEFKFTNKYFHSYTVLMSDPEVKYFLDDNFEVIVQLDARQGTMDPDLDKPGLSGMIRIRHVPDFPILPLSGVQGVPFLPRSKEVVFKNRLIRPVYLCYCSEDKVSDFQGLVIENEGEFKGLLDFGAPELVTTSSGLIAYKFVASQSIPMKFLWKGYFRLERTNQLGVYKKTLPNPIPQSIKYDAALNDYISENFVKL